jgi:hypothetical protein
MAWLGKIETDSILVKEKCKHLSKTSVSRNVLERKRLKLSREGFIEVYIISKVYSLSYRYIRKL